MLNERIIFQICFEVVMKEMMWKNVGRNQKWKKKIFKSTKESRKSNNLI